MAFPERGQDGDQEAFLPKDHGDLPYPEKGSRNASSTPGIYVRLCLEVVMAFAIFALLLRPLSERNAVKRSPVPDCMHPSPSWSEDK